MITKEQFLKDVAQHELTINLDQGVYRDITVAHPNTMDRHFNITTRPGYLIFTGDMGSFVFTRLNDMFKFFRKEKINPGYWHKKLEAIDSRGGAKDFSSEIVKEILMDHLNEHLAGIDTGNYDSDEYQSNEARDAIQSLIGTAEDNEQDFYSELGSWDASINGGIDMDCWWEWDFKDFTSRYIWCCYAIVHAIKLYDEKMGVAA